MHNCVVVIAEYCVERITNIKFMHWISQHVEIVERQVSSNGETVWKAN